MRRFVAAAVCGAVLAGVTSAVVIVGGLSSAAVADASACVLVSDSSGTPGGHKEWTCALPSGPVTLVGHDDFELELSGGWLCTPYVQALSACSSGAMAGLSSWTLVLPGSFSLYDYGPVDPVTGFDVGSPFAAGSPDGALGFSAGIDWTGIAAALASPLPDVLELVGLLLASALTIAFVWKGGRVLVLWATRSIGAGGSGMGGGEFRGGSWDGTNWDGEFEPPEFH
jgi:hypothetical protein